MASMTSNFGPRQKLLRVFWEQPPFSGKDSYWRAIVEDKTTVILPSAPYAIQNLHVTVSSSVNSTKFTNV